MLKATLSEKAYIKPVGPKNCVDKGIPMKPTFPNTHSNGKNTVGVVLQRKPLCHHTQNKQEHKVKYERYDQSDTETAESRGIIAICDEPKMLMGRTNFNNRVERPFLDVRRENLPSS